MKKPFILAAVVAATLSSALVFAQAGGQPGGTGTPGGSGSSGAMGQPGSSGQRGASGESGMSGQSGASGQTAKEASPAEQQQEFVRDAASGNAMEIQVGQFVASHSQNAQVKQFAQTLVQDHQKSQQQLKQAAQQANAQISEDNLTPVHKAMAQEIEQKSGKELDRAFLFSAVADHHKDILEYTFASENLPSAQLKQYAAQSIPVLQKHYQTAEELARSITGVSDKTTASAR